MSRVSFDSQTANSGNILYKDSNGQFIEVSSPLIYPTGEELVLKPNILSNESFFDYWEMPDGTTDTSEEVSIVIERDISVGFHSVQSVKLTLTPPNSPNVYFWPSPDSGNYKPRQPSGSVPTISYWKPNSFVKVSAATTNINRDLYTKTWSGDVNSDSEILEFHIDSDTNVTSVWSL